MEGKGWDVVYVASGQLEAQVIKSKLECEGIPVVLKYDSAGLVFGFTIDGLGEVNILVPKHLAQEAKELVGNEETLMPEDWMGE